MIGRQRVLTRYTKGREFANYRGTSILSIPGKIYGIISISSGGNY